MPLPVKLITGLGNPGPDYYTTRHSAGFWFVDALAGNFNLSFHTESRFHAQLSRLMAQGHDCWLCKPATFMNESGYAVQAVTHFYNIPLEQTLIVHDDIDLEAGLVRLKQGGGHGGHNGLRDIIQQTGNNGFMRLRIGVGHPGSRERVTPHVLGRPDKEDQELIITAIASAMDVIGLLLDGDLQGAMNRLHTRNRQEEQDEDET